MKSSSFIRHAFLDYFEKEGHRIWPSSSLVPDNDPSLLFINSGMAPLKAMFLGEAPAPQEPIASCQKCIRAGGKHNDLSQVGKTERHHTFFEMLGNFSFGQYLKEQAIFYAWEVLTKVFDLDPKRLWVTVHQSDGESGNLWKKISGLPEHKILTLDSEDNFWSMGPVGPCGPSTEIFYDHGEHLPGGVPGSPTAEGPRFVEVWNVVFMTYQQMEDGSRRPLPKPAVDTGMGLERLSAVLRGSHDNYDNDIFSALIQASSQLCNPSFRGKTSQELRNAWPEDLYQAHRILADHIRASSFLIADGVLPSNEGRGYVLRRILRRAFRYTSKLSPDAAPFFYRLVAPLCDAMGGDYPELLQGKFLVEETLRQEEERFTDLLKRGLKTLQTAIRQMSSDSLFPGKTIFLLYDTFGFPADMTELILEEHGLQGDWEGFQQCLELQKSQGRKSWKETKEAPKPEVSLDPSMVTAFQGYAHGAYEGSLLGSVPGKKGKVSLILDHSPFYPEGGGQISDQGIIFGVSQEVHTKLFWAFQVEDVQKYQKILLHEGEIKYVCEMDPSFPLEDLPWQAFRQQKFFHEPEALVDCLKGHFLRVQPGRVVPFQADSPVLSLVFEDRRRSIRAHHSATHLLQAALVQILGPHVRQMGSLVTESKLRFDFSHFQKLTQEEIDQVEALIYQWIRENHPIVASEMGHKEALGMGASSLSGEKYQDRVRVIRMGVDQAPPVSFELCGGLHSDRTGDLGIFKIISEKGMGTGVRRLEACVGEGAFRWIKEQSQLIQRLCTKLKVPLDNLEERIESLGKAKPPKPKLSPLGLEEWSVNGVNLLGYTLNQAPPKNGLKLLEEALDKGKAQVIFVKNCGTQGKVSITVGMAQSFVDRGMDAKVWLQTLKHVWQGRSGGGKPKLAQGGGEDFSWADLKKQFNQEVILKKLGLA